MPTQLGTEQDYMPAARAFDHPEAADMHHHMVASDDGMPEPAHGLTKLREELHEHPKDLMAQNHAEGHYDRSRAKVPEGNISPSAAQVEAKRAEFDRLLAKSGVSTQELWSKATNGWDLRNFQARNIARSEAPNGFNHTIDSWSLNDWLVALVGEVGEAANIAKKLRRFETNSRGNRKGETHAELQMKFADELADAFIYLMLVAARARLDVPTIVENKFAQVSLDIGYVPDRVALAGPDAVVRYAKTSREEWDKLAGGQPE